MKLHLTYKSVLRYVLLLSLGVAFILFSDYLGFFEGVDLYLYDLSFRIRGSAEADKSIIIAAIDEKTLEALGRWPIGRRYYAEMLASAGDAKVVGIDVIMAEKTDDDDILNAAMKRHGRVVLPVYIESGMKASHPVETLSPAADGHIHVEQGIDGVIRTVFHTLRYRDAVLPSFASAIYGLAYKAVPGRQKAAGASAGNSSDVAILQSEPMHINYAGPPGTFPHLSLIDVINGRYPDGIFRDKIVLAGVTTPGIEERMLTPFTQHRDRMAGVEVHANILNNMIAKSDIRFINEWVRRFAAVAASVIFFFLFIRTNERKAAALYLGGLAAVTASVFGLFSLSQVWAAPAIIYVSLTFMFLIAHVVRLEEMGTLLSMANEEWYRTFNDINDAIIVHDCNFTVVRANRAAGGIIGTRLFEHITIKCREHFMVGGNRDFSAVPQAGAASLKSMEIFDALRNRHLEVLTMPRLDGKRLTGVIQIIRDITERKQAEESIRKSEEQLRNLTAYIQKVSEIERTNIAREIHDELGQALTVLKIDLSYIRKRLPPDYAALLEKIDAMSKIIDKTITTVKKISTDLRPGLLDDLGLSAAIEWQAEEFEKRTGIACKISIEPKDISFDKDRNTALFRILQETMTNIARHAEATEVMISLRLNGDQIELVVQDNGKGIREEEIAGSQSFGLMGLKERAVIFGGSALINGTPGLGTTVAVRIPAEDLQKTL